MSRAGFARLMHAALWSTVCCVVRADTLRNEFLAAYGHQHLITLTHLERAGELMSHEMLGCSLGQHSSKYVPDSQKQHPPVLQSSSYRALPVQLWPA